MGLPKTVTHLFDFKKALQGKKLGLEMVGLVEEEKGNSEVEGESILESLGSEFVMYLFQTNFYSFFSSELE